MTIAEHVRNIARNSLANSFQCGYAINWDHTRTHFPDPEGDP